MAQTNSRTLEIILRARDFFTRTFQSAGRAFVSIVRGTFGLGFNALRSGLALVKNAVFGLGAAFAGVFALSRISAFASATLEEADALHKLATALGTTTERMSELKAAFDFTGVSADFEKTLRGLTKAMSQIFTRGAETRQGNALRQLGIDLGTLRDSDPLSLLQGIARGLEQYSSEAEKAAIMSGVFGDDFDAKLLVLLGQGEKAFMANIEAAKLYGATLRGDLAAAAEVAGDQLTFLKLQLGTAFRDAVLRVARALTPAITELNRLVSSMRPELVASIEAVIRMLIRFAFAITNALLFALEKGIDLIQTIMGALDRFLGFLQGMGVRIPDEIRKWFTPLSSEAAKVREEMGSVAQEVVKLEAELRKARAGGDVGREHLGGGAAAAIQQDLDAAMAKLRQLKQQFADLTSQGDAAGSVSLALDTARIAELREILRIWQEQALAQFDIAAATDEATDAAKRQTKAQEDNAAAADGFFARVRKGFVDASTTYADFLAAVQSGTTQLIEGSLSHIEDMFVSWVTGAQSFKEAFKDMARSVLADIARWIVRLQLLALWQAITNSFASGSGRFDASGAPSGISPPPGAVVQGGAGGGGRRFVQLSHGLPRLSRSGGGGGGPQGFGAGAGGGNGQVQINFNISATDGESVRRMLVQERQTIMAVVRNGIATSRETRLAVRGASA